jgi:hypothetical protein
VTVEGPVTIDITTALPESFWKSQLDGHATVDSWSMTSDGVTMTLESGIWTLSLPQSTIDGHSTSAAYLVSTDSGVMSLDQYGDPVNGVSVTNDNGTFMTGPDGEVTQGEGIASIDGMDGEKSKAPMGDDDSEEDESDGDGSDEDSDCQSDGNSGHGDNEGVDCDNPGQGADPPGQSKGND